MLGAARKNSTIYVSFDPVDQFLFGYRDSREQWVKKFVVRGV